MLALARIAELRRGTAAFPPSAEMMELLDCAEAMLLLQEEGKAIAREGREDEPGFCYWEYGEGRLQLLVMGEPVYGYADTPQAAVLAALKGAR